MMSEECFKAFIIIFCALPLQSFQIIPPKDQLQDPAVFYTTVEFICSEGYPAQQHKVVTEDGYILTIQRIPNNRRRPKIPPRFGQYQRLHTNYHPDFAECMRESADEVATGPPVLLTHGIFAASDNWVLQGSGYDLAYLLSDAGYDVWFTNIRGNFYSRAHTTLLPSNPKFWDFSFHECGLYDLPAIIDYILQISNFRKIFYIGHSMGTTMFFIMNSLRPEYNDKIQLFVGFTPLSQIKYEHLSPERKNVLGFGFDLVTALRDRGVKEVMPRTTPQVIFSRLLCAKSSLFQDTCYDLVFFPVGYHSKLFLRNRFPLYLSHGLSGNSVNTFLHYVQLSNSTYFRSFDYGPEENLRRYGQREPLRYDLKKVTCPVALYYSEHDYVVNTKDVQLLLDALPNIVETQLLQNYSHVDYVWAYNAKDKVYKNVMALMDKFRIR